MNAGTEKSPESEDIGDFTAAATARRKADRELPMRERLARVHSLSKQMNAIKGSAQPR